MIKKYDYIIIGLGPSSLTLAYHFSKLKKHCLILERDKDIGGCHSVRRVDNYFSEHGPRMYSNRFINFINILNDMNINFYDHFVDYKKDINEYILFFYNNTSITEKLQLLISYILFLIYPNYYKKISVKKYFKKFNIKIISYINRLCIISDGMDSSKYSMSKLFNSFNQNYLYKFYQPNKPNDVGFIKLWVDRLDKNYITIINNSEVIELNTINNIISSIKTINHKLYYADKYILCIPPKPMYKLLYNSKIPDVFKFNFKDWVFNNSYNDYISITFHFNHKIDINNTFDYIETKNELIYVILSDYFNDVNNTIISTSLSVLDDYIHSLNYNELINETYTQLIIQIPELKNVKYYKAIINPNVKKINNKWISLDTAFISTINNEYIKQESTLYVNLYNVGTQNNYNEYDFTTIETSIINSLYFIHKNYPNYNIKILKGRDLKYELFKIFFLLILVILIIIYY